MTGAGRLLLLSSEGADDDADMDAAFSRIRVEDARKASGDELVSEDCEKAAVGEAESAQCMSERSSQVKGSATASTGCSQPFFIQWMTSTCGVQAV